MAHSKNSIPNFKKMFVSILIIPVLLVLTAVIFTDFSPPFGGKTTAKHVELFKKSANFKNGKFINKNEVEYRMSFSDFRKIMSNYTNPQPHTAPDQNIETQNIDSLDIANFKDSTRLIWFGHSTFLLQISNKNILIDPMFGETPSPFSYLGTKRFSNKLPIAIEQLPTIDVVLISHDHYDHLDYPSIIKLKDKVDMFYTPLGVGIHLEQWGVAKNKIAEHDWWENTELHDLNFICTPAQHFSGRGLKDKNKTLWSSWIIKSKTENIFFSGDSGYGEHFKTIGDQYGPFDFAMIECGQYNTIWPQIHMFPEETVQAGIDLKATRIMPIHWGAFKLSVHTWKDPIERFTQTAKELDMNYLTPEIGMPFSLNEPKITTNNWWDSYN